MTDERQELPRIRGYRCFACGTENPIGLKMTFYRLGDQICSDLVLGERFVGWENMAHGGVVSAVLDEVMAWTILYYKRAFCVTRQITVRYLKPLPVETPVTARARLLDTPRRFACQLESEIVDAEGTVLARAEADFALLREKQLNLIPEHVRRDMLLFVSTLGDEGLEGVAALADELAEQKA